MDFDLTDEQRLLKDSVDRLIADRYAFEQRKKYMAEPGGWSSAVWNQYAELGLLGLPFDEQLGGFGGGAVETMIVMEAFGRGLVLEPYFATVILGGGLLRRAGSDALRAALVPQIIAGKLKLAFAHVERQSRYDLADVSTTARKDGAGYVLDGAKSVVLHGDCADKLLVTARAAGGRRDRGGVGLFLVDASAPGVTRRGYPTQDGLRAAELALSGVRVAADEVLGEERVAGDRARGGRGDRRAVCRGGRHDAGDARNDRRLPEDAPAVRPRRSARSRCCSTAPWICWWRWSRRAAWRCSPR